MTQGGVHLSLHNENFVDLGAGPQGLDHRVAALDDSVGGGLVPCPVRAGLVVFVLHKTPIPARRPKEEISGKKSREPAYFRYYIMDFREEKAPFPGKFQEREFRSHFRQPRPPGQGENFHKFLTPMSQAVPCNKKGNMIPYRYQMGKVFPGKLSAKRGGIPCPQMT